MTIPKRQPCQAAYRNILDYAIAHGWRSDNPAGGVLNAVLPRRPRVKAHHRALPYAGIAETMKAVRKSNANTVTRLAFEFLVLTVARAGEVREAVWREIDLGHTDMGPCQLPA